MLSYDDVSKLFIKSSGISDRNLNFHCVCCHADIIQPKGLFVPAFKSSGTLLEAISHGAVGCLWQEADPLPSYIPNHFPVFYTDDLKKGLMKMMKTYEKQVTEQTTPISVTQFIIESARLIKDEKETYDIAGMAQTINQYNIEHNKAGEQ